MTLRGHHEVTANDASPTPRTILKTWCRGRDADQKPVSGKGGWPRSVTRTSSRGRSEVRASVEAVPERYRLALLLAAWCALRRGEVLGLQRADIDMGRGLNFMSDVRGPHLWANPRCWGLQKPTRGYGL